ncbi:trigger factor [Rubellimicrobium sp. CFH 75288]|uniref:trigger factor n=1 Tax=Rubellimicrobium sp. CFH 75288 TaxID=2697034 RepID=UPI001412E254|nr:trigger factor [Rubellimicrobium sp. CFH 75288]NAZ35544.1 trigger factor [Rubellimicrobium sp. CFH 75288]
MDVTETLNEGLKRGYRVTVTAAELDQKVTAKLQEVQPQVAMKGFRKGKVPLALLRKQHGARLLGEAMQETIDGAVSSHLAATGDRPSMQPSVRMTNESWKEGDDVVVEVTYERLPDVPQVDLSDLSLTRLKVEPDDAAVDEALARLADQARTYEDRRKGTKAKDGDQVVIDFTGRLDGEAFEGGSATDYPLVLGSGSFIPGFEEGLAGVKAGEEREVTVTFPESYGARHLAGREAVFAVTVKAVREPKPHPIDDALAKRFGADDLEALRVQVRDQIAREYEGASRAVLKRQLLDALDARADFPLPENLVKAEADQIAHQLWHEEHPEVHGHDHGAIEPTEDHLRLARRRVKLGLLLADIGTRAEVKVTEQELTQAVLNEARRYRGQERQFFEYIQSNAAARQQLQAPIFEDKVVDHILSTASVEDRPVSREDLQKAVEALDQE